MREQPGGHPAVDASLEARQVVGVSSQDQELERSDSTSSNYQETINTYLTMTDVRTY